MQQKVKSNEPEFTSQVVSWMNSIIEKGNLPFEIVTSEPSIKISGDKTRFPDIQIWLNRRAGHGFCLCELKPPEVKVAPDG